MSDIASKINEILGSEEGMNQIRSLANSLGLNTSDNFDNSSPQGGNPDGVQNQGNFNVPMNLPANQGGFSIDPAMLLNLQSVLSKMNTNDNNTQLLMALKCHLSEERQKKVDDAVKIMQLVKILPLIKEMGLFGGDKK